MTADTAQPPLAEIEPARSGLSWMWLVPLAAIAFAGWLGWQAWGARGATVTIQMTNGHGLVPGSAVRFRGIDVGVTENVELLTNEEGVVATVRLAAHATSIARVGSRFWVVRPRVGWDGIGGLDTLIGRRYLAVLPGSGAPQRHFIALEQAPLGDSLAPGLDITLLANRRDGLAAGSPLRFRGVRIGTVITVGMSSDAARVTVAARIRHEYAALIREETHFWTASGLRFDAGFTGVTLDIETLESLVLGGISLAVPPNAGAAVTPGHRFVLHERAEDEWLDWAPPLSLGSSLLPAGVAAPAPQRAVLDWSEGRFITTEESRSGWVIATSAGWLAPRDLLVPPDKADDGSATLDIAGERLDLAAALVDIPDSGLALRPATIPQRAWVVGNWRAPDAPEDCAIVGDAAFEPLALSPGRFVDGWHLEPALSLSRELHGAPVVARADGAWIGVLIIDRDGAASVAPLPGTLGEILAGA